MHTGQEVVDWAGDEDLEVVIIVARGRTGKVQPLDGSVMEPKKREQDWQWRGDGFENLKVPV